MQSIEPRGLRRAAAAAYLGISRSHFDTQREAGNIPAPKKLLGVVLWDRRDLDSLFDGKAIVADNDNVSGYWDEACANANPNT